MRHQFRTAIVAATAITFGVAWSAQTIAQSATQPAVPPLLPPAHPNLPAAVDQGGIMLPWDDVRADQATAALARKTIDSGLKYLLSQQKPDGSWQNPKEPPGITAIVLKTLAWNPELRKDAQVAKGYEALLKYQNETGGIYKDALACYNTAIAISALAQADNPTYRPAIDKAMAYLKSLQWTDAISGPKGEKVDVSNPWYGGWGYGGVSRGGARPDLSNTQMALDALKDAGLKADDPAFQAASKFVTRLQNFSETNDRPWVGNDGGFIYGPADSGGGESFAGEYTGADGKRLLRSYGSMTYAGLKSMVYAGLTRDDPRVTAAWGWIGRNWTLDENPGMRLGKPENAGYGLYYYYQTLGRALAAYGEPMITDPQGVKHDWRKEVIEKLSSLQRPDGSWAGEKKWYEDNPVLATAYAVSALQDALDAMKN